MRKRNFMKWSCSTMDVNIHNVFSETLQQQTRTAVIKTIFIYPCIEYVCIVSTFCTINHLVASSLFWQLTAALNFLD